MRFLLGAALILATTSAVAQMYRWTDPSGRVHFTDTPPPAAAKNVQRRGPGAAPGEASGTPGEPYALQMARKSNPVKLYSTPGCGAACDEARKLLNARGVPFTEVSVSSEAQITELKNLIGTPSVPALVVGSNIQKGFESGSYHAVLDSAGYPRTGILQPRNQAEPKPLSTDADAPVASGEQPADAPAGRPGPYTPR